MAALNQFGQADDPTAYRRALALQLMSQGLDTSPVRSWTQGAARLANALVGSMWQNQNTQDQTASMGHIASLLAPDMTAAPPIPAPQKTVESAPLPSSSPYGSNIATTDGGDNLPMPPTNPLGRLDPTFRSKFADLRSALANQGVDINAPEAGNIGNVRTPQQQAQLYAQGRTAPGPIVTGTLQSNHLTGNALDVVPLNASPSQVGSAITQLTQNDPRFAGMRSGATFSNLYDPLHVEANNPTALAAAPDQLPPGATPSQYSPPQAITPQAAPSQPDIKSRIAQLLSSNNPWDQKIGLQLAGQAIAPALQPPQAMKIQNRDGSESIVFVNPSQMRTYGQGGMPVNSDNLGGGTPHPEMSGDEFGAFLQKNDPGRFNLLNQMHNGEIAPAQMGRYGTKTVGALLEDAARIWPDFNQIKWEGAVKAQRELSSGTPTSLGGKIQSLQNSVEHLANTSDAAVALHNSEGLLGTSILSTPYNYARSFSNKQKDIINRAETEAVIYGGERTKFLTGRAGEKEERMGLKNKLSAATAAPQAMAGAIEGEITQLEDAVRNQEDQIKSQAGESWLKAHPLVKPQVQAGIDRIKKNIEILRGKQAETTPSQRGLGVSPAGAAPGMIRYDAQGNRIQ